MWSDGKNIFGFARAQKEIEVICICTITVRHAPMLMYGKEASNRKQEIDRQHHTIPNQRTKDSQLYTFPRMPTTAEFPYSYFSFGLHSFVDGEAKDKLTMKH